MILALDLGTSTGAAFGRGDALPTVLSFQMPASGDDVGAFLAHFRDVLVQLIGRIDPDFVIFEAPILPQPKASIKWVGGKPVAVVENTTNLMTTRKLQGLAGMLEVICRDLELPVYETHLGTMKKALTGKGNAEKGDMLRQARALGLQLSAGSEAFDEADAFAAWLVGVHHGAREHRDYWDRRIFGWKPAR